jgi:hypothetical protein
MTKTHRKKGDDLKAPKCTHSNTTVSYYIDPHSGTEEREIEINPTIVQSGGAYFCTQCNARVDL